MTIFQIEQMLLGKIVTSLAVPWRGRLLHCIDPPHVIMDLSNWQFDSYQHLWLVCHLLYAQSIWTPKETYYLKHVTGDLKTGLCRGCVLKQKL